VVKEFLRKFEAPALRRSALACALFCTGACNAIFGLDDLTVGPADAGSGPSSGTGTGCVPECPSTEGSCVDPVCDMGACSTTPKAAGAPCTADGGTVCDGKGACVQCMKGSDCPSGVCNANECMPIECTNGTKDGTESDVDCGGNCPGCSPGKTCGAGLDCLSGVCTSGTCQTPTCVDGVKNGSETDVDCGSNCPGCAAGLDCVMNTDCASGICDVAVCAGASCTDGLQNGGESDIDCGGPCAGCPDGGACVDDVDCESGLCKTLVCSLVNGCAPATATDLTGMATVTVTFGAQSYNPKCYKVTAGTMVTYSGNFVGHDLYGGEVVGTTEIPDPTSPFMPPTSSGNSKTFTLATPGDYPFYCGPHGDNGMNGAAFVVP